MITDINSEDRLVQQTFAEHLEEALGSAHGFAVLPCLIRIRDQAIRNHRSP